MATFKFNEQAKQIFLEVYNDPSVSSKDLPKVITEKLVKEGFLEEGQKITAKLCRVALEDKLQRKYVNRPRVKHESMIMFEEETEDSVEEGVEEVEEDDSVGVEYNNDTWSRPEPNKFEF